MRGTHDGASTRRRLNESHSAQRPKNNTIRLATGLATGESMPKFVQQYY